MICGYSRYDLRVPGRGSAGGRLKLYMQSPIVSEHSRTPICLIGCSKSWTFFYLKHFSTEKLANRDKSHSSNLILSSDVDRKQCLAENSAIQNFVSDLEVIFCEFQHLEVFIGQLCQEQVIEW